MSDIKTPCLQIFQTAQSLRDEDREDENLWEKIENSNDHRDNVNGVCRTAQKACEKANSGNQAFDSLKEELKLERYVYTKDARLKLEKWLKEISKSFPGQNLCEVCQKNALTLNSQEKKVSPKLEEIRKGYLQKLVAEKDEEIPTILNPIFAH